MTITIKYFASLRETHGDSDQQIQADDVSCVADIMRLQSIALPENILVAVNMEYADSDTVVADGDEVAFFPPVTGG